MRIGSIVGGISFKDIRGSSSSNGFIVIKNGEAVKSERYNPKEEQEPKFTKKHVITWAGIWIFYAFIMLFPASTLFEHSENIALEIGLSVMLVIITGVPALFMMIILFYPSRYGKDLLQYHACEHKIITLLEEKKLAPTLENLKKMPRVAFFCGTTMGSLMGVIPILLGAGILVGNILPETPSAVTFLMVISFCIIAPLLLQALFTTREPSEDKLKEALEVAKKFYK